MSEEIEFESGTYIREACQEALDLAKSLGCTVRGEFKGTVLEANPEDMHGHVLERYYLVREIYQLREGVIK
jgi:hypothetical protein